MVEAMNGIRERLEKLDEAINVLSDKLSPVRCSTPAGTKEKPSSSAPLIGKLVEISYRIESCTVAVRTLTNELQL
jgi:hypothetical protein